MKAANVPGHGVVAALPTHAERGVRFASRSNGSSRYKVHVPRLITLAWYQSPDDVRAAQRWRFTVRLRRPHGTSIRPASTASSGMLEQGNEGQWLRAGGTGVGQPLCLQQTVCSSIR